VISSIIFDGELDAGFFHQGILVANMDNFDIQAETRFDTGKGSNRKLRRNGFVPAVIYGGSGEVEKIKINHNAMLRNLEKVGFYSNILELTVEKHTQRVFLKALARHPSKKEILHADFQRVDDSVQLNIKVPVNLTNEEKCIGVKQDGGVVSRLLTELEITCLPKDLPQSINVDIENLGVGEAIHLSDLVLPVGVELTAILKGGDDTTSVVQVSSPKVLSNEDEEVESAEETETAETETQPSEE